MVKFIIGSFLSFISLNISAQNAPVDSFVNYYESVQAVEAKFRTTSKVENNPFSQGEFLFMKPSSIKLKVKGSIISSDGKVVKTYNAKLNRHVISNAEEYDAPLNLDLIINSLLAPEKILLNSETNSGYDFIIPVNNINNVKSLEVFTDMKFKLKRINVKLKKGGGMKIEFLKFKTNPQLDTDSFNIKTPENARIVDIR